MIRVGVEVVRSDAHGVVRRVAKCLRQGRAVVFPTDTVYGIGCHAFLEGAVASLYRIKGRCSSKPIALLLGGARQVEEVTSVVPEVLYTLAEVYWPGALTLVVPKGSRVPSIVSAGRNNIGVRVPDHPFVLELIQELGAPIATTSANLSGQPAPATADEVVRGLGGRVGLVVDGGHCPGGIASTVVDLTTHPPRVLREGALSVDALRRLVPGIDAV